MLRDNILPVAFTVKNSILYVVLIMLKMPKETFFFEPPYIILGNALGKAFANLFGNVLANMLGNVLET